jgi:hypothetical protein
MHMDEQILLLFEGAMEVHCNRKKEQKMPFRCFKKIIELNLNSFLIFGLFCRFCCRFDWQNVTTLTKTFFTAN